MSRYLITSALPYINGVKHLGNLVGSMLPADVMARYYRSRGDDVLYICATDEHGTPAELAAADAGLNVAEFCDQNYEIQRELGERFLLSFDHFARTSRPQNHELTQHFAQKLNEQGYIEKRTTSQVFSLDDQRFLPDRYVVGTCPNCGYQRARGDQCEHCTKQLDPTELIDPVSAVSGSDNLEIRDSDHLFLLQSQLADDLRSWIDQKVGTWPKLVTSIAYKWLDEGLQDRGITRDLSWGVSVPWDGFENKVFYVWFDAPIGYIAATREWAELEDGRDWESWWRTDKGANDVHYIEVMAKDNIPFHTLGFPATIIGSGEPWKLVDTLKGFNWLNYYGGKFSTSEQRGVFMADALELRSADYWRWYLMANAPESTDTSFTWELFADAVNKDLSGTLGNFVNRIASQIDKHFDSTIQRGASPGEAESELVENVRALLVQYIDAMDNLEFRKATSTMRKIWAEGNVYLERREPWRAVKTDTEDAALTLRYAAGLLRLFGHIAVPFMPESAAKISRVLPDSSLLDKMSPEWADTIPQIEPGAAFETPPILFEKVTEDEVTRWVERFGGEHD